MWYAFTDILRDTVGLRSDQRPLRRNEFWSAENISFKLKRGQCLGLIGPNGAGKSTLLRMLNGIILPDRGRINMRGRIGTLIEVGAGFHPMLTGRENIYINGSILGLSKKEIDKQFDRIVDFSDMEEFLDSPIKYYSSGMTVRLGFSVAVHLQPDVMLIDEVLAVGDLSFQAKCRQRIQKLVANGAAIIFVSHNMHTVSYLCQNSIVLSRGRMLFEGDTAQAIDVYRASVSTNKKESPPEHIGSGQVKITRCEVLNVREEETAEYRTGDFVKLRMHYQAETNVSDPVFNISIFGTDGSQVTGIRTDVDEFQVGEVSGEGYIDIDINHINLLPGLYTLCATIYHPDGFTYYDHTDNIAQLRIGGGHRINGTAYLPHSWCLSNPIRKETQR